MRLFWARFGPTASLGRLHRWRFWIVGSAVVMDQTHAHYAGFVSAVGHHRLKQADGR